MRPEDDVIDDKPIADAEGFLPAETPPPWGTARASPRRNWSVARTRAPGVARRAATHRAARMIAHDRFA